MISVSIAINGNAILARSAVNTSKQGTKLCKYELDDGSIVYHDPSDGCVALAKKMLDTIDVNAIGNGKG